MFYSIRCCLENMVAIDFPVHVCKHEFRLSSILVYVMLPLNMVGYHLVISLLTFLGFFVSPGILNLSFAIRCTMTIFH
jgi:hypothetical protein